LADSTFVSQSRRAAGLLVLVLVLLVLVLGLLILVLAVLRLGPGVPGLGLGVTWGVTLVAVVG
jgi:hypothetical protein